MKQLEPLEKPLPEILIQLAGLVPAFNIFTEYLAVFVDIWSEVRCAYFVSVLLNVVPQFHNEALSFATELEKVSSPTELPAVRARTKLTELFRLTTEYSHLRLELSWLRRYLYRSGRASKNMLRPFEADRTYLIHGANDVSGELKLYLFMKDVNMIAFLFRK